jgi:hypothetical protein
VHLDALEVALRSGQEVVDVVGRGVPYQVEAEHRDRLEAVDLPQLFERRSVGVVESDHGEAAGSDGGDLRLGDGSTSVPGAPAPSSSPGHRTASPPDGRGRSIDEAPAHLPDLRRTEGCAVGGARPSLAGR